MRMYNGYLCKDWWVGEKYVVKNKKNFCWNKKKPRYDTSKKVPECLIIPKLFFVKQTEDGQTGSPVEVPPVLKDRKKCV